MFDYHKAFDRNIGWVTEEEQTLLRGKRIAIAGLGGVGGSHLLTLTRLGIGAFNIADFDRFEVQNFNRQAGASMSHLDQPKVDVMAAMAADINPEIQMRTFPQGVDEANLDEFLDGVDLYVDSLDFFALSIRNSVFSACAARGIPAVTAAPLGMGAALLVFMPGGMTFDQYFGMRDCDESEMAVRFFAGVAPARLQLSYVADPSRVDFKAQKAPSMPMGCDLCAGFAGSYALKILLNRGEVPCAPRGIHFDAYRNKLKTTWLPWGSRNPMQQLAVAVARKRLQAMDKEEKKAAPQYDRAIERVLDLARWAPSGDNEQPWQFEILDDARAVIHATDTRDWCVYDLDGSSSQIAVGALLESIAIAASAEGMRAEFSRREDAPETAPLIDVELVPDPQASADSLQPFIRSRVTQRKPFSTRPLTVDQKRALEAAVGDGYSVVWVEGKPALKRMAKLLFHNAHIRLTTPEAYEVHRRNIEWGVRFSEDRLPEHAVGIDLPTRIVMRWALKSWGRVKFLNRFFAGTWLPRVQMDWRTSLGAAAHFVIVADKPMQGMDDYIAGGRAMQRFWLESARQGLQFQPEMTPIIFSRYVAQSLTFTEVAKEQALAARLASEYSTLLGGTHDASQRVFMGRIGFGQRPSSRSIRPPLEQLLISPGG